MKRREFILTGTLSSLGLLYGCSGKKDVSEGREGETLSVLGETLFQKGVVASKGFDRKGFEEEAEILFRKIGSDAKMGLKWMMRFLEFAPIISLYSFRRFSSLPLEKREEFVRRMAKSRFSIVRMLLFSLKTLPALYYFSDATVKRELGIKYKEEG